MSKLLLLFAFPIIASLLAFIVPGLSRVNLKRLAVVLSLAPLGFLLYHYQSWIGESVHYNWMPVFSVNFDLKMDSLSLVFVGLSAIIIPISLLSVNEEQLTHPNAFYGLVLLLEGLLFGFFTAHDLVVFAVFWESMLLPLYFIISLWGIADKQKAALKFIVYMIAGSFLMIVAVLALYFSSVELLSGGTFNLEQLASVAERTHYAGWLFGIFVLAFAVKTPMFPFHAWLPDVYTFSPTSGTILLSAILSKAGIYGFFRIGLGLFPIQMQAWGPWLLGFAIAGVFYGAFSAWRQSDFKRLIAYSSFSHVNFVLAGIFVWNDTAHTGAIIQALNHGITIAALFLVAGWLEDRLGSRLMGPFSGLAKYVPHLCWLTLFFVLASVALPGMNNFIGEFLILFGVFSQNPWTGALLTLSIIFSAVYMLRFMQKVYFEDINWPRGDLSDIRWKEYAIALPLMMIILGIGFYPNPLLDLVKKPSEQTVSSEELK